MLARLRAAIWSVVWPAAHIPDDTDRLLIALQGDGLDHHPIRGASDGLHRPDEED